MAAARARFLAPSDGSARRESHHSLGGMEAVASVGRSVFSSGYQRRYGPDETRYVADEADMAAWVSAKREFSEERLASGPSSTTSSAAAGRTWRDVWGSVDVDAGDAMEDAKKLPPSPATETPTSGPRRQISIANLLSDAPSTYDEYVVQREDAKPPVVLPPVDDGAVRIKKEPVAIKLTACSPPLSTPTASPTTLAMSTIPEAFQRTQSFVSARDFFVPPSLDAETDGTRLECTICQISLGNRVYSLKRHLFRHHPHVFRVADSFRRLDSPSSACQLDLVSPTSTSSTLSSSNLSVKMEAVEEKSRCQCGSSQRYPPVVLASRKSRVSSADQTDSEGRGFTALGKRKHASPRDGADDTSPSRAKFKELSAGNATAKMNEAFASWLSSDVIPMEAINSKLFRQFVALVNPTFKIPKVVVRASNVQQRCQAHDRGDIFSDGDADCDAYCDDKNATRAGQEQQRVMTALCIHGDGGPAQVVRNVPVPTPRRDEALIRVLRAGICGTDLAMMRQYKPGYAGALGHEFVGIVEQLGADFDGDASAHERWIGKRVVAEINIPCDDARTCETCAAGLAAGQSDTETLALPAIRRRNHCPRRACLGIVQRPERDVGGAFARFVAMPVRNLHAVPDSIVDAHAVFAEPLAAACRITEQGAVHESDDVAVLGDGKLGLLVAETLHAQRAAKSVALVGKHRDKLALAKHFVTTVYGFEDCSQHDGQDQDESPASTSQREQRQREQQQQELVERITRRDGRRFDVCVDATGSPSSLSMAMQLLRPGGTVVVKSTVPPSPSLSQASAVSASHVVDVRALCRNRLRLRGSRCGPLPEALRLLRDRRVDVQKLVAGVYPLVRGEQALAHAGARGAFKVQLLMGE